MTWRLRHRGLTQYEWDIRRAVWNFKDGACPQFVLNGLARGVKQLAGWNSVVCFLPASTREKTLRRYGNIKDRLARESEVPCTMDAIRKSTDGVAGHLAGKEADPAAGFTFDASLFRGKNVILVDDVVTRGNTLKGTARRLLEAGAASVSCLVVARTVNPLWGGGDNRNLERVAS